MTRLELATPRRRTRRYEKGRHGERVDLRRTLRRPSHRRRSDPSRAPASPCRPSQARAALRHLRLDGAVCARLPPVPDLRRRQWPECRGVRVRHAADPLTRPLLPQPGSRHPGAAEAAPDWSSGTWIGEALQAFNDRHGRRGMARGAVVVILSDGWARSQARGAGDGALAPGASNRVGQSARERDAFAVRSGGMVAALPHCDALVSGHSFEALREVAGGDRSSGGG